MTFADLMYKFFAWIYNNKQTLLGSFTAALAFIQASSQLRNLMSANTYEWLMLGIGLLMVLFARSSTGGMTSRALPPSVPPERPPTDKPTPSPGG